MAEALAVVNVTAARYFAGAADATIRKRLFLALLAKYGRIKFNEEGDSCSWDIEYAQPPVQAHGASGEYEFTEHDLYRQLEIDWRGYVSTDKMDFKNTLMNKGAVAIVNRYSRIMPGLRKTLDNHFHSELYIDGNVAGNENRLHGMLSFLGAGTCVAADLVAAPSDTYAGKSTVPQAEGGTWSNGLGVGNFPNASLAVDWPSGSGASEYDYICPVLCNITSENWGTGSSDWEDNCGRILRRVTTWLTKNAGQEGRPTLYMLGDNLFNSYQDYQEAKFRNVIPHPEGRDLGFPDTLNQDGVMVKYEFDTPAGEGFGINIQQMELSSLDDALFGTRGPYYDIKTDAYLFKAGFFGNARYNPKYFAHLKAYA